MTAPKFDLRKVWSSSTLPSLPTVAVKLLDLAKSPEPEIRHVVDTIKTDPAISAKLLKSANSSFFGFAAKVNSVDRAVPLLGTTAVTSLALSFSLAESAMGGGPMAEHYSAYWKQSVVHAAAAESLSSHIKEGLPCEYFLAGLLMDIGRLALLKTVPRDYLPVLTKAAQQQTHLFEVEREDMGSDHAVVGAQLMRNWGIPETLALACEKQHCTAEEFRQLQGTSEFYLCVSIAVSRAMGDYFCGTNKGRALQRLQELSTEFLGQTEEDLERLLTRVRTRIHETGELLAVNFDELGDPADLMAAATEQLAALAAQAVAMHRKVELEKKELETRHEELQQQALHDPLTKVYNRRFFEECLHKEVQRCCRSAAPLGIVFLDIDHFKRLNDTCGHMFGDIVLQRVAKALGEVLRTSDTLARFGGEEFVVVVNEPTEKGLQKMAERIRARIEAEKVEYEGRPVPVTVSVGAALAVPSRNDAEIGAKLIAAADEAMYESKQGGRNQVHFRSLLDATERRITHAVTQGRFSRWLVGKQVFDIPTVSRALLQFRTPPVRLGELAVRFGLLSANEIDQILLEQERTGQRFGAAAIALRLLTEEQLVALLVRQQEDPQLLTRTLVQMQLIEPVRIEQLHQAFRAEHERALGVASPVA